MFKFVTTLLLLIFTFKAFPQVDNQEFRSTWVITWEFMSANATVDQNKAKIRKILDDHKAANMNAVLWHVRQGGTAYYQSSYEPWGSYAGGQYPGFDPLQYAIEEAHKRGMEIHGWFNVFATSSTAPGAPAREHPNWICRDANGNPMTSNIALSPGLDSVRNYTLNVAMELVRNYDLDGLHLDYIRWNEYTSSANSEKFARYQEENKLLDGEITTEQVNELNNNNAGRYLYDYAHPYSAGVPSGYSTWEDYWRASVTELVRKLHDSIQVAKPWVRLSVAAIGAYNWSGWNGYNSVYQDAALWFNQGYIDQLTPMHYSWDNAQGFYSMLQGGGVNSWANYIQPGITAGRLFSAGPGSYILEENNAWNNHPAIVNISRTVNFVDGFQFFSYGTWADHGYFPVAGETFFAKKTKIRDSRAILNVTPPSPSISMAKVDSLHYRITVTPPAGLNKNQWFVIYRSENNNFIQDSSEIVKIVFDDSIFVYDEVYTGTQNYNGQYRYSVTMADRYWNESNFSNQVMTDAIPSFAPVVVTSIPEAGDTVAAATPIVLNFSKSLDPATVITAAFSFSPTKEISGVALSNNNKTVKLTLNGSLLFATQYTLTAANTIKDVNGKAIDGDGNGMPGDAYNLHFRTVDADVTAPMIVSTNNSYNMDIEDVFTAIFDEILDSACVNTTNVILKKDGTPITAHVVHTKFDGKSIITLKSPTGLTPNSNYTAVLTTGIKDVWGNNIAANMEYMFTTNDQQYDVKTSIDDFTFASYWQQPSFSGSTVGIIPYLSVLSWVSANYIPTTSIRKSAQMTYAWDDSSTEHFLREYLLDGPPRGVTFDTTFTLQMYLYGDASGTKFRFAIDEGAAFTTHEVSQWTTIDWVGWKLIEWKLSDPSTVGTWIGNGVLDNPPYRMDSFQFIPGDNSASSGVVNFDNLRIIKRSLAPVGVNEKEIVPKVFALEQNYPNPFNPSTQIKFALPIAGKVKLAVYNSIGQEVEVLVNNYMEAGVHNAKFNAVNLTSGVYFYSITTNEGTITKKMILLK